MLNWIKDVDLFVGKHWSNLQESPLHIYSLLAFAPLSTIFQTIYAKSMSFPHPVVVTPLDNANLPSNRTIHLHEIEISCLSDCGNWFATGGTDGLHPVYGLWDVKLADGKMFVHPCGEPLCSVATVALYRQPTSLRLRTICRCGLLCEWDPFNLSGRPLDKMQLDLKGEYQWSKDGRYGVVRVDRFSSFLWKQDAPHIYKQLCSDVPEFLHPDGFQVDLWMFSPDTGEKLVHLHGVCLEMWDCIEVRRLFSRRLANTAQDLLGSRLMDTGIAQFGVRFAQGSQTVVVQNHDSITCLSSNNGTAIWTSKPASRFNFAFDIFSDGEKIVIYDEGNVKVVSAVDGSTYNIG
jgi:hypothetical protein